MEPSDVAASYDRLAGHWASSAFDHQNGMRQHERALTFVSEPGAALDVGCGSSGRFIELLRVRGFQVEGVDVSAEMLRLARLRHPQVPFHQADICSWSLPRSYRFISAWDSVWHVPLARQAAVLQRLFAALDHGGVVIFSAGGLMTPGERQDEGMGVPMYHATLGVPHILNLIDRAGCMLRHFEYDQFPEPHVFFIAQKA